MGIDYTFYLRVGYSLDEDDVIKPYSEVIEKKFHYEDRFDPKTGAKLKPVKIIDQRGGTFLNVEYEGSHYDNVTELIQETSFFQDKFDCEVSQPFDCADNPGIVNFCIPLPKQKTYGGGKVTMVGESVSLSWLEENKDKLLALKSKLEKEFNIDVGEPKIFVESWIG